MTEKKNFLVEHDYLFILALAIFTLMFYQSTRQFLASIYYENLASMGFTYSISFVIVFLAPLLLLLLRMINVNIVMAASGCIIVFHRLYGSLFAEASMHIIFHAIVIIGYGLYLPAFLTNYYSLNAKSQKYSIPMAVITAPILAILMDNFLNAVGDGMDLTYVGIVNSKGLTIVHPLIVSLIIGSLALLLLFHNYNIIQEELTSVRTTQRGGETVSTFLPGICIGFTLSVLFIFMGYPGIVVRWTTASYTMTFVLTSLFLFLTVIFIQLDESRKIIFNPITQIVLNSIQIFVILDIIFIDSGSAQYLLGVALSSLLIDMFIFYHSIGSKNYSIQYFIHLITISIVTFLLIFMISVFSLVWAHIGPSGEILKGNLGYILSFISMIYVVSAVSFNNRVRLSMVGKKWRKAE